MIQACGKGKEQLMVDLNFWLDCNKQNSLCLKDVTFWIAVWTICKNQQKKGKLMLREPGLVSCPTMCEHYIQ